MLDVSDRSAPKETGRYVNAAMKDKQQAYNNLVLAATGSTPPSITRGWRFSTSANRTPSNRSAGGTHGRPTRFRTSGSTVPAHESFGYDAKQRLVYLSAGDSELQVVDVSKPARPVLSAHISNRKTAGERGDWRWVRTRFI